MTQLSFQGTNLADLSGAVTESGWLPKAPPRHIYDSEARKVLDSTEGWLNVCAGRTVNATFGSGDILTVDAETDTVHVELAQTPSVESLLEIFEQLPFETAAVGTRHPEWYEGGRTVPDAGFKLGHTNHGLACAFKAEGYQRLASKRILEHGPWHLTQRGDLSLILFHDPDVDALTALEQAVPGYEAMGYQRGRGGILLGSRHVYHSQLQGRYTKEDRLHRILVVNREVPLSEMQDACELRYRDQHSSVSPIDRVAFVFAFEEEARRHLHELWLRGLGCWVVGDGGSEKHLDEDYAPTPTKPDWVAEVEL